MFNIKSKKITLPLFVCVLFVLLTPVLAQAELGGSGGTAARDAAEQRAAKERKLEKKKQKEAEASGATEAQQGAAKVEESKPAETQGKQPAAQ